MMQNVEAVESQVLELGHLVLSRKIGQSIRINDLVSIQVISVGVGRVKLRVSAPRDMVIRRSELPTIGLSETSADCA